MILGCYGLILVIVASIYYDKLLVHWQRFHCNIRNAESPNGHNLFISGESEFKRTMRTDPQNETHDYELVKDEMPDSDSHDDKLASTDDELIVLELLRDQETCFLAYTTTSGGRPITAEKNGTMTYSIRTDPRTKPTFQTNKSLLFLNVQHKIEIMSSMFDIDPKIYQ